MIDRVFRKNSWTYQRVDTRQTDLQHLKTFDRSQAPVFQWPPHLKEFDAYQWEREQKAKQSKQK